MRRSFVQLALLAAVIAVAVTAVAVFIPWLPVSAGKERDRIDLTFWLATGISIMIFSVVAAAIIYAVVKFRVRPDDDSDGPPIHGHTGLEIVWTIIPTALVTVIAIVSGIVLHDNGFAGKNPVRVAVTAQQFAWSFKYLNGDAKGVVSPTLYLARGQAAKLEISSLDVIHSFWVPEFGQKQDALPGRINPLVITPTKTGTYPVICTELCGLGHSLMRSQSIVLSPEAFTSWARTAAQKAAPPTAAGGHASAAEGKAVFAANGCGACHTLTAAGSQASVGPNLDRLAAYAKQAGRPLAAFVRESIVDPNGYVQHGFKPGIMPPDFGKTIPSPKLDALVQYLVQSSKGGSK